MRSKDIIAALENTDDKYIDSAIELMAESKPGRASGFFSVLKFAGAAAAVVAVVLAIWIPTRFFPRDPEPVQPGTATETNAPPTDTTDPVVDPAENNVFLCDGKAVRGVIGVCDNYVFDNDRGTYVTPETDTVGVYEESVIPKALLTSEDQPTLYYKKGAYIHFNYDERLYYLKEMTLWYSDGVRTVASCNNTIFTLNDIVRDALDNHPGTYCLTAELIGFEEYGAEYKHVVYGVKLVSEVELPDRYGYNVFLLNGSEVESKLYFTARTRIDPETGQDYLEREGVETKAFLKDKDVPVIYFEKGDSLDFRSYPDYYSRENYVLYTASGESVAGGWTLTDIIKYLRNNPGEYRLTVEATMSFSALSGMFDTRYEYYGVTVISCEEAGADPDTDAGRVIALAQSLAGNGYDEETWQKLLSYGDTAFDTLIKRYFDGEKDIALRTVISNYASYLFKAEAENQKNDAFTKAFGGQKYLDLQSDFSNLSESEWLYKYRANARSYAEAEEETVVAENTPNVYRLLGTVKFKDYTYYPERHGIPEMVEEYIRATLAKDTARKTGIIANYLKSGAGNGRLYELIEYCVKRYRTEEDEKVRALLCWIAYNILRYNSTVTDAAFREAHDYTDVNENNVTYKYVVEILAPYIADYEKAAEEYAKTMLREYVEADAPVAYTILTAYGFDGYKPGKPDISFYAREAISALNELYQAANYGNIRYEGSNLIGKIGFTKKTYTMTKDRYTDSHDRYECDEEEFYAYFDKYLPSGMARSYVKTRAVDIGYLETEDVHADICLYEGKISLSGELMYQAFNTIAANTARLIKQDGNKATISVEFVYGHGMTSTPVELELEIVKDDNGIRITGGELIDKTVKSSVYSMTGTLIYDYMIMRECVFLEDRSIYGKVYSSYDELPNDMKKSVDPDAHFPLILKNYVIHEWWIDDFLTKEVYDALIVDTTDVYDGEYLYPDKAPGRVEQAFFGDPKVRYYDIDESGAYTGAEVLAAMKIIKSDEHGVTISLDFKVDGKIKAYTFEYTIENGSFVLTGGTFVTELILGK